MTFQRKADGTAKLLFKRLKWQIPKKMQHVNGKGQGLRKSWGLAIINNELQQVGDNYLRQIKKTKPFIAKSFKSLLSSGFRILSECRRLRKAESESALLAWFVHVKQEIKLWFVSGLTTSFTAKTKQKKR